MPEQERFIDPQRYASMLETPITTRLFDIPTSARVEGAPFITAADIALALRGIQVRYEWALYTAPYSTQRLLEILREQAEPAVLGPGMICERCFDAMAVALVPASDLEDAYGVCLMCQAAP